MQQMHPLRLSYEFFSSANPMMGLVAPMAEHVRKDRRPISSSNPFLAMQENMSRQIVTALDAWRDASEAMAERTFLAIYGLPSLQAAVGIDPASTRPLRRAAKNPLHRELLQQRTADLKSRVSVGGPREAVIRGLLYVGRARASVDERGFEAVRRIRETHSDMSLSDFKRVVREQFYLLLIDQDAALGAIPSLLPRDADLRRKALGLIEQALSARGDLSAEERRRMQEVARLFGLDDDTGNRNSVRPLRKELQTRAS
jgi:hypothetical protein